MFQVRQDLKGHRFGRLVVVASTVKTGKYARWECLCDCGVVHHVDSVNLKNGSTQSCGCLREQQQVKHGQARRTGHSPTYYTWTAMVARCTRPTHTKWPDYGGRGITVCKRWRDSFESFLADMGERPAGKTIDRYPDNDGNYEPGNCRWATPLEQAQNKRPRKDQVRHDYAPVAES